MKQVVQNHKSGELAVLDVPVPGEAGRCAGRSAYSLISTGTELMKVSEAGMSMLGKARSRRTRWPRFLQSVATNGVPATYRKVMGKLVPTRRWATHCAGWSSRSAPGSTT